MYQKIIEHMCLKLAEAAGYELDSDKYQVMRYGFEALFLFVMKTTVLLLLALILGLFWEMVFYVVLLFIIRSFCGGLHLKNNFLCTALGFLYFFGGVILALNMEPSRYAITLIFLACLALNGLYAPAPTEKRPVGPKTGKRNRILSVITLMLYYILTLIITDQVYANLITVTAVVSTITILPCTYKIFGERRPGHA